MVSSAENMKKTCHNEFFKDDQNCTSLKDECDLKFLKTWRASVFFQVAQETLLLPINQYTRNIQLHKAWESL
jgi:hypothetical protein